MSDDSASTDGQDRGGTTRLRGWAPALTILVLAPFLGETFSTASSPLELIMPWALPLVVGMYGCGALICREIVLRYNFTFIGLCLLGVAYGVYEEGLIDRFWFDPDFWQESGVQSYSTVGELNILLASHLTMFHIAVSICMSIIITEWIFPSRRDEPWVGPRGMAMAVFGVAVIVPIFSLQFRVPSVWAFITAGILFATATMMAFKVPRATSARNQDVGPRRRGIAWIAFAATASQFTLTYAVPNFGLPWPAGLTLSVAPVLVGWVAIRRLATTDHLGRDGIRVVSGMAAFFIPLGVVIGLAGRFDLSLGALIAGVLFFKLNRAQKSRDMQAAQLRSL